MQENLHSVAVVRALRRKNVSGDVPPGGQAEPRRKPRLSAAGRRIHAIHQGTEHYRNGDGGLARRSRVFDGALSPGDLVVFASYINDMYTPIQNISELAVQFMESLVSGERVLELVQTTPRIRDHANCGERYSRFREKLRLTMSCSDMSRRSLSQRLKPWRIRKGETVAIVGGSGAGKSTMLNLLLRFFDPWEGRVLIDGQDVRSFKLRSMRSQISVVMQESILFRRPIRDNIAYGKPNAALKDIVAAARAAEVTIS